MELQTCLQHLDMDFLQYYTKYSRVRDIIRGSSARTSGWYRKLFCSSLINLAHTIKVEYKEDFLRLSPKDGAFIKALREGHTVVFDTFVAAHLKLDSPGRFIVTLAFVAFLLDQWDAENQFSSDFALETLTVPLWLEIKRWHSRLTDLTGERILEEPMTEFSAESSNERIPSTTVQEEE